MKNIVLIFGTKEINTIENLDINDIYRDGSLSKKEKEVKLLQCIDSSNGLKAVHPFELKQNLIVRFELNSVGKVILCISDTAVTYITLDMAQHLKKVEQQQYVSCMLQQRRCYIAK